MGGNKENAETEQGLSVQTEKDVVEVEKNEDGDFPSKAVSPVADGVDPQLHPRAQGDVSLATEQTGPAVGLVGEVSVRLSGTKDVAEEAPASASEATEGGVAFEETAILDVKVGKVHEVKDVKLENGEGSSELNVRENPEENQIETTPLKQGKPELPPLSVDPSPAFIFEFPEGDESGTEEEQNAFMHEIEKFHRENSLEFKAPKFYGEGLNCLKLWRGVTKLGGYDQVTSCKLWRQVGESFRPPKTCTTVSWSFRIFYEKALLEYEKHKVHTGELRVPVPSSTEPLSLEHQVCGNQASGSGRARRDAVARAMQGWHSQRLLGNADVGDPVIKDKSSVPLFKREKHLKTIGLLKRKKSSSLDRASEKVARTKISKQLHSDAMVVDVGPRADWVKVNMRRTKDCFEVYALVPGLLREEVHVQSDPAGRLVISGEPEQLDNPWGVTPFKKVITLPSRIDPHHTSAVVTLLGQLFIRAPFEQPEA